MNATDYTYRHGCKKSPYKNVQSGEFKGPDWRGQFSKTEIEL